MWKARLHPRYMESESTLQQDARVIHIGCLRSPGLNHQRHSSVQTLSVAPCGLKETIHTLQLHPSLPASPLLREPPHGQHSQAQRSTAVYARFPLQECLSTNRGLALNLQNQPQTSSRKPSGTSSHTYAFTAPSSDLHSPQMFSSLCAHTCVDLTRQRFSVGTPGDM